MSETQPEAQPVPDLSQILQPEPVNEVLPDGQLEASAQARGMAAITGNPVTARVFSALRGKRA